MLYAGDHHWNSRCLLVAMRDEQRGLALMWAGGDLKRYFL